MLQHPNEGIEGASVKLIIVSEHEFDMDEVARSGRYRSGFCGVLGLKQGRQCKSRESQRLHIIAFIFDLNMQRPPRLVAKTLDFHAQSDPAERCHMGRLLTEGSHCRWTEHLMYQCLMNLIDEQLST